MVVDSSSIGRGMSQEKAREREAIGKAPRRAPVRGSSADVRWQNLPAHPLPTRLAEFWPLAMDVPLALGVSLS